MGRSVEEISGTRDEQRTIDIATLDDRIGSILTDIEGEKVPGRLLELATALQHALRLRRDRRQSN
jgi:hypothetical protein